MAYNTSKGTRDLGDIQNENDKDTQRWEDKFHNKKSLFISISG